MDRVGTWDISSPTADDCASDAAPVYGQLQRSPGRGSTVRSLRFALDIIGEVPARPGEEAGDVSIGPLLTRLKNGVKDAPQNAGLVRDCIAPGGNLVTEARGKVPVM